ncbi:MAG: class I SAM-dependent methyltransferase [Candidatus Hydrogenedentes bacterium]|nr:class I SAM-dependent methyltransferase [Candidatus Hydrogenedentota bacterium]
MNTEEYACMRAVEDAHWWYRGLHTLVLHALARHAPSASRIVDIGCGTGGMASRLFGKRLVAALDFNPDALTFCRARGIVPLVRGDGTSLPIATGCADVALVLDVLYHKNVADPGRVLSELRRVLTPGGVVVINVPAYQWLYSSHDVAVQTGRRFTRGQINGLLREAGFDVVESTYWNTALFPAICAVRLLRRWVPPGTSDVKAGNLIINRLLGALLAVERACMRWRPLPFGVSVFVVARVR